MKGLIRSQGRVQGLVNSLGRVRGLIRNLEELSRTSHVFVGWPARIFNNLVLGNPPKTP